MNAFVWRLVVALLVVFSCSLPALAWSKPQPVDGVYQMFNAFNKLESEFRNEEWDKSLATIVSIQAYYAKLTTVLKHTVPGEVVHKFGFFVSRLRRGVENREEEAIEDAYMALQGLFLDIMGYYDYPTSPVLRIFARYIEEAKEGSAQKNFHETAEEMEEIAALKGRGIKALAEAGATQAEIDRFFETIAKVEKAAQGEKMPELQNGLGAAEDFINRFVAESPEAE